jgi:glycosidase
MWGADDPDERKPIVWGDLKYDDESAHPFGRPRRHDQVRPDTALLRVYRTLIGLRKDHLRLLVDGELRWLETDDARGVLTYERSLGNQSAVVAFNVSDKAQTVASQPSGRYRLVFPPFGDSAVLQAPLKVQLPPRSARVWVRE